MDDMLVNQFKQQFSGIFLSNVNSGRAPIHPEPFDVACFGDDFLGLDDSSGSMYNGLHFSSSMESTDSVFPFGNQLGGQMDNVFASDGINPLKDPLRQNTANLDHVRPKPFLTPHSQAQNAASMPFPPPHADVQHTFFGGISSSSKQDSNSPFTAQTAESSPHGDEETLANERFWFPAVLDVPTAMVKHETEPPVTYLNRGQIYHLSVVDSARQPTSTQPVTYRTTLWISFEDEQRPKASACWQLWKETRGWKEAQQREAKLQALEFVDLTTGRSKEQQYPRAQLESATFDGFSVTWTADPTMGPGCSIPIRCNFLSTDFILTKGTKGISVRLCAKTETLSSDPAVENKAEITYCKVKLFRDHGAERKISNDIAHVRKKIEKAEQQMALAEKGNRKRKRTGTLMNSSDEDKSDPQSDLKRMQTMLSSSKPVTLLSLEGEDDMGFIPQPSDEPVDIRSESSGSRQAGVLDSIEPSQYSSRQADHDEDSSGYLSSQSSLRDRSFTSSDSLERLRTNNYRTCSTVGTSQSPSRSIACLYVLFHQSNEIYYRAIYLNQRTVQDLVKRVCEKQLRNPDSISRVVRVKPDGIQVLVDDEAVEQILEGQDMLVEFGTVEQEPTTEIRLLY
ncbi:hypothetical protein ASPWEDRAFT_44869 [Aspergillus wentii DTO 134E9]|uniref:Grh/CP2 DB domain-containing protein n=1 Tax=Aspergillus wentii DTO 134E9 TaxID=1073089 RepID=A0A1L9R7J8_ASPWE|nr:uncharacterized protein ASPWEDRAFT_44869 [Aspergillus wentii DTO 134E9]OJJ30896.1 hypothetical protein ASPWEDRAFT_44869 [Aspergillus wentii DTO 134E9]